MTTTKYVVGSLRGNRRRVEFDTIVDATLYMRRVRWPSYLERVETKRVEEETAQ